jgi:choline dehydrogenase-like flavoprotein
VILDADGREDDWFRDRVFDVCVVGSGPAGITLARALAEHGRTVGLFEGGGRDFSTDSQELYGGDIVGEGYRPLDETRLRFFGGTSNHWSGVCRALDECDFAPRPANPNSGWPISKSDLDGYAEETDQILDLESPALAPNPFRTDISPLKPITFRLSPPTRFGSKYARELSKSTRLHTYLNANLVGIGLDESHRTVSEFRFKSFNRAEEFSVRAVNFALCLGGIENARALLNSQGPDAYAIGNEYGLVGRNFCEHLHFNVGVMLLKESAIGLDAMGPRPEFIDRAHILNFGLRLQRAAEGVKSYLEDIECSTMARKIAEVMGVPPQCTIQGRLRIASEQALNPDNRVRLTDTVDRFGWRRVALGWHLGELDIATIRTAAIEAGRVFAKHDLGRIKLADWVLNKSMRPPPIGEEAVIGNHHMCTTRMSADPTGGVVDANCRIHGMENLFVGGSSVFATGGQSNPTYTIVQLALRLADHLHERLG